MLEPYYYARDSIVLGVVVPCFQCKLGLEGKIRTPFIKRAYMNLCRTRNIDNKMIRVCLFV